MTVPRNLPRCPKRGAPFCRTCAATQASTTPPAPPPRPTGPGLRTTGKVRNVLRCYPHMPIAGPARPRFVREVYRDMLGGFELEGGLPLPDDLRLEVVRLSNASKCTPPLDPAALAEALRGLKGDDT